MSITIMHCADLHLDSPFDSLPEEKAVAMRNEQRSVLLSIFDIAAAKNVDLVLLAGDLLDSAIAYYETTDALISAMCRVSAPIFIAPGNHDYYSDTSPYGFIDFPDNVHIFKSQSIECVELPDLGCRVYGAAFTGNSSSSLMQSFCATDDGSINLMVLHGDIAGSVYNRITTEEIAESGLDYLALGHVHTYSGIQKSGRTYYAYPGCAIGRGFDELGEKGIIIGTVDKNSADLDFVPVATRQYLEKTLVLSDIDDLEGVLQSAVTSDDKDNILRITLTGEYDGELDCQRLAAECCDNTFHCIVKNRTVPRRDIWEGLSEDTLKGSFLRIMQRKYNEAETDALRDEVIMAVRYALAAIENREESGI